MRRRIADGPRIAGAADRDRRFADRPAAAAAGDPQLAAPQGHARADSVVHRRSARPHDLQALRAAPLQARARGRRDARILEARGRPGRGGPERVAIGAIARAPRMCLGLAFFSTDLTTNDSYRTKVESIEGQELLAKQLPGGRQRADRHRRSERAGRAAVTARRRGRRRRRGGVRRPVAQGDGRRADPGDARAGALLDRGVRPDRPDPRRGARGGAGTLVGGASAVEFDVREAAAWDSKVIPPIVLLVVFLILVLLLRALIAPLVLIGTVILSFLAALGVGVLRVRRGLRLPGLGPVAAAVRVRVPGRAGRGLQHLPRSPARGRRRTSTAPARACCARWRSPAA